MRDRDAHLQWCLNKDTGIRFVAPSENLVTAYREKSKTAIRSMEINRREGIAEWVISTSYYAKYFIVYALFAKLGAKSEIHSCTIALFEYLFGESIPVALIDDFRRSRKDRIEMQYYPLVTDVSLEKVASQTKTFVLEIERLLESLNTERIEQLQHKLRDLRK